MNAIIQKFLSTLTQSLNTIFGNIFRNSQGDILDVFNPVSFAVNFTVEGILFILLLVTFPIFCSGIYGLSKRKGLRFSILSFLPGAHIYFLGKLAGEVNLLSKRIKNPQRILLILYMINYLPILDALDIIPFLGSLIEAISDKAYYILLMVTIHRVYEIYTPKKADSLIIIGIPFQFLNAFFMYRIRNNAPVNSKLVLDYDFDGVYDEDVMLHIEKSQSKTDTRIMKTEHLKVNGKRDENIPIYDSTKIENEKEENDSKQLSNEGKRYSNLGKDRHLERFNIDAIKGLKKRVVFPAKKMSSLSPRVFKGKSKSS